MKVSDWEVRRARYLREVHEQLARAIDAEGPMPLPKWVPPQKERHFRFQRVGRVWRTEQAGSLYR